MSEQGWREFLTAEGVGDWVVLHGGAAAVFVVPSMTAAVRLAEAVAGVPGLEEAGPLLTVSDICLSVRLTAACYASSRASGLTGAVTRASGALIRRRSCG
jgi:4a-hydroxytetrahydrobiopterin dehydratase